MAKNKTEETVGSVADFILTVKDEAKQHDSKTLVQLFEGQTGLPAKMWGAAIIGFGSYTYRYDSGHNGTAPLVAFSPRASAISLYMPSQFPTRDDLLAKLGKHKSAKACIYVKKLSDVDYNLLKQLIKDAFLYAKDSHK